MIFIFSWFHSILSLVMIQAILFYIFYGFVWLISFLPLSILYVFSDFMYFLAYHIVGYRKKTVFGNLKKSFPEKSNQEVKTIAKKFYQHLCDFFIEILWCIHLRKKELQKRYQFINTEAVNAYARKNIDVVAIGSHYGNWEWLLAIGFQLHHDQLPIIYRPLKNKYFDWFITKIRTQTGGIPIPMNDIYKKLLEFKKEGTTHLTGFLGDQRPPGRTPFWTIFLNQETAFFLGPEKIAKKIDAAVFFLDIRKVRRGYYEVEFVFYTDKPRETKEYEITKYFARKLEEVIREKPEYWLWSHKRWKYKRPENIKLQ